MEHTPTEQAVYEMLVENTGVHMLDSGGAYGRNWQRNQVRTLEDFQQSKRVVGKFDVYADGTFDVDVSLSTFHFLVDILDYDEQLTKSLWEFGGKEEYWHDSWPETIEKWLEQVDPFKDVPIAKKEWDSENSYNGESLLTQVIQFWYPRFIFDSDNAPVILQIHGGCDVRGGYTSPRVFYGDTELFRSADARIMCRGIRNDTALLFDGHEELHSRNHYWQTDDAYNWYFKGCSSHKLDEYSALKEETNDDVEQRGKDGLLHVDDDGNGYCPICGGLLEFGF